MELNDDFYSRLVGFYEDLNDEKIQNFNARLILILLNELENKKKIEKIFQLMDDYKEKILK